MPVTHSPHSMSCPHDKETNSNSNFCTFKCVHAHSDACMHNTNFLSIFPLFFSKCAISREIGHTFYFSTLIMEELAKINFIVAIEGQESERSMAKIVSHLSKLKVQLHL